MKTKLLTLTLVIGASVFLATPAEAGKRRYYEDDCSPRGGRGYYQQERYYQPVQYYRPVRYSRPPEYCAPAPRPFFQIGFLFGGNRDRDCR